MTRRISAHKRAHAQKSRIFAARLVRGCPGGLTAELTSSFWQSGSLRRFFFSVAGKIFLFFTKLCGGFVNEKVRSSEILTWHTSCMRDIAASCMLANRRCRIDFAGIHLVHRQNTRHVDHAMAHHGSHEQIVSCERVLCESESKSLHLLVHLFSWSSVRPVSPFLSPSENGIVISERAVKQGKVLNHKNVVTKCELFLLTAVKSVAKKS